MVTKPLIEGTREFSVLFPMASIFFSKAAQNCFFCYCEMTLFWQNLLRAVWFGQNVFFLAIAGKNSRFCQTG